MLHFRSFCLVFPVLVSACVLGDIFGGGDRSELEENREKWNSLGIVSYTYRLNRSCFCGFAGPADVTVVNGAIVSVRWLLVDTTDVDPTDFSVFATVDDLFVIVDDAIRREAHQLTITYDQQFGFPDRIAIDYMENTVDDEITLTASGFSPQ